MNSSKEPPDYEIGDDDNSTSKQRRSSEGLKQQEPQKVQKQVALSHKQRKQQQVGQRITNMNGRFGDKNARYPSIIHQKRAIAERRTATRDGGGEVRSSTEKPSPQSQPSFLEQKQSLAQRRTGKSLNSSSQSLSISSSSSPDAPGAFRIGGGESLESFTTIISNNNRDRDDNGKEEHPAEQTQQQQQPRHPSGELISAFVVDEEQETKEEQEEKVLAHAKVVDRARIRRFRILFICLGLLLLVVVVVLSVLLRRGGPLPPSLAPSLFPSASPSFSSDGILQLLETESSTFDNALAITTEQTPQFRAAQWILSHTDSGSDLLNQYSDDKLLQRYALAVIYFAMDGPNWLNNMHWIDVTVDECEWYFSTDKTTPCNDDGILLSLPLRQNFLRGSLPLEVALLTSITILDLVSNEVTGTLPSSLGRLTQLETIEASSNFIEGTLPAMLGQLKNLSILELADNQITCPRTTETDVTAGPPLPPNAVLRLPLFSGWDNLTNLLVLSLRNNPLRVNDNFNCFLPTEIGRLSSLQKLDLSETRLGGSLPTEVGELTSLVRLFLPPFYFVPFLPTEFGRLTRLASLDLSQALIGLNPTIPTEIGLMTSLDLLDLSTPTGGTRRIGFAGTVPTEIGLVSNLRVLDLSRTRVGGTFPVELERLHFLERLGLEQTGFFGTLPFLGHLSNSLEHLDISDVIGLNGTLPEWIGSLTRLTHLDLSFTGLSGPLPSSIFNLTNLNVLRLALTQLTGDIENLACNADGSRAVAGSSNTVGMVNCSCCSIKCKFESDVSFACS